MEKMTKMQWFEELKGIVLSSDYAEKDEAVAFIEKQMASLEAKAEKAKEKAAEKKAAGDALRATIENLLTDELQTIEDLLEKIGDEEVTKAKVSSRLGQLVTAGIAEKEAVKSGSRKVMAYRLCK